MIFMQNNLRLTKFNQSYAVKALDLLWAKRAIFGPEISGSKD